MNEGMEGRTADIVSMDFEGRKITLREVPVLYDAKRGVSGVRLSDLQKAEQKYFTKEQGVSETQCHELLLLYAKPQFFKNQYIDSKFRFNKMLFYYWQKMMAADYGDSFVFDEFESCRAGPIPKKLKNDIIDMCKKGLVELVAVKDGKRVGKGNEVMEKREEGVSKRCQLTKKGLETAEALWNEASQDVKEIALKTKQELGLLDSGKLKDKIHKEFPKYQRTYNELDTEEFGIPC